VYSSSDILLAELGPWVDPTWIQTANLPSTLTFTYPVDDEFAVLLTGFNQIGIRDSSGILRDLLPITKTIKPHSGATVGTIAVQCTNMIGQLGGDKSVSDYTASGTIQEIVADVLADYQGSPLYLPIKMGYIAPSIGSLNRSGEVYKNMTPLAVINSLWQTAGGYFYVDTSRRFNWIPAQGTYSAQELRLGHNMNAIEVGETFDNIYTSVTMYGYGMSIDTRLSSTKTNNTGTYGTREFIWTDTSIRTQTALDEAAQALVEEMSQPQKIYKVGVIDLSKGDNADDYTHLANILEIGSHLNLVSPDPAVQISTTIVKITRHLARPIDTQIEVSDPDAGAWGGNSTRRASRLSLAQRFAQLQDRVNNLFDRDMGFDKSFEDTLPDYASDLTPSSVMSAGSPGSSEFYSRGDHVHEGVVSGDIPVPSDSTPEDIATAGSSGVSADLSREDHVHDYSSIISDSTPEEIAATGSAGISADLSRKDHVHAGTVVSDSTPEDIGTSGAAGTGTESSRDDHVHDYSNILSDATPGTLTASSGFAGVSTTVSRSDHRHTYINKLSNSTPQPTSTVAGAAGSSTNLSRADHVHYDSGSGGGAGLSNATPQSVGTAGPGTGVLASRDDHVHDADYSSTPAAVAATGSAGSSAQAARGDHRHAGVVDADIPDAATATPENLKAVSALGSGTKWAKEDHSHGLRTTAPTVDGELSHVSDQIKAQLDSVDLSLSHVNSGAPTVNDTLGNDSTKLYVRMSGVNYGITHYD
jgi:hypothetical protein